MCHQRGRRVRSPQHRGRHRGVHRSRNMAKNPTSLTGAQALHLRDLTGSSVRRGARNGPAVPHGGGRVATMHPWTRRLRSHLTIPEGLLRPSSVLPKVPLSTWYAMGKPSPTSSRLRPHQPPTTTATRGLWPSNDAKPSALAHQPWPTTARSMRPADGRGQVTTSSVATTSVRTPAEPARTLRWRQSPRRQCRRRVDPRQHRV